MDAVGRWKNIRGGNMKKFIVDFGGEEEYNEPLGTSRVGSPGGPDWFIVWDDADSANTCCHDISRAGHPCWVAKFIGPDQNTYFGTAVGEDAIRRRAARSWTKTVDIQIEHVSHEYSAFSVKDIKIIDIREYEPTSDHKKDRIVLWALWVQRAKADLEEHTGGYIVNAHGLWGEDWAGGGVDMRSIIGGKQWIVFDGVSDARAVAVAKVSKEIADDPMEWGEDFLIPHIKTDKFYDIVRDDAESACESMDDIGPWLDEGYDNANAEERGEMRDAAEENCMDSYIDEAMMAGFVQYFSDREGPGWLRIAIDVLGLNYDAAANAAVEELRADAMDTGLVMQDVGYYLGLYGPVVHLAHGGVAIEVS